LTRHRQWYYSNVAHGLLDRYGVIAIEKLDLADMAKKERSPGEPNPLVEKAREYRTIASIGELLSTLKYAAEKRGARIIMEEAAYTTMKCSTCGEMVTPADRSKLKWTCDHCGDTWDQDINAAMNLFYGLAESDIADQEQAGKTAAARAS
jgi:putative transposase